MPPRKAEVVEPELDSDDIWNELVTENAVPPMKVRGIVLEQPTVERMEQWRSASSVEEGEKALFGDKYEQVKSLFRGQKEYVWENFNKKYLLHMFGVDAEDLKG